MALAAPAAGLSEVHRLTRPAFLLRTLGVLVVVLLTWPRGSAAETPPPASGLAQPPPAVQTPPPPPAVQQPPPPETQPPPTETSVQRALHLLESFRFGTYGRIGVSGDLREGSKGRRVNVVAHGPRLEEPPYVELDLGYELRRKDALSFRVASTVAFMEDCFHYNGKWDAQIALRNLYAEATHVFTPALSLWVGSRMYRGDDIYLLDYWPLDLLNTVGGGVGLHLRNTRVQLHAGVNRLDNLFQLQTIEVPNPRFGTDKVTVLDRQRTIVSVKGTQEFPDLARDLSLKLSLYGEVHRIPAGTLRKDLETEDLPADTGWVAGLQVGLWGFGHDSHVNLWVRVAGGLAAYGELVVPTGLGMDRRSTGARDVVVALSGNYERGMLGLMLGGYVRYFQDADTAAVDPDDGWEYVLAARPHLFLHRYFHQVFEVSVQGRRPNGLDPQTQTHLVPTVFKFSVMPTLSWDRGTYTRPQIRLLYTLSYLDAGAQLMFPIEDPRRGHAVAHFLGAQVEWWWNSSYR